MPQAGWYPDPSAPRDPRAPMASERWFDGQRWTTTVRTVPTPPAEPVQRRRSVLLFVISAVVVVALLIAGVFALSRLGAGSTVGPLPTSTISGYDDNSPTPSPDQTATPTPTPSSSTASASARPADCDNAAPNASPSTSTDPARIGAGQLSFAKLTGAWTSPYSESRVPYGRDTRAQAYVLPEKKPWAASANVGITAFPSFPGLAPAAAAMLQCVLTSDFYVSVQVQLTRSVTRSTTVSGHQAVQLDATLTFSDPELTTKGSALRFVIVDTKPATFLFLATPIERRDLLDQAERTTGSLRVS